MPIVKVDDVTKTSVEVVVVFLFLNLNGYLPNKFFA